MILKSKKSLPFGAITGASVFKVIKNISSKKLFLFFSGCLIVVPAIFLSAVYAKAWFSKGHLTQLHKETIQRKLNVVRHLKRRFASYNPVSLDIPRLNIDIKFENYQKISQQRDEALLRGHLVSGSDSYVPAKIRHKDKTLKVKLRLKGDTLVHLGNDPRLNRDDKWSFRIKVRRGDAIFGMRKFSIQHPFTRDYESEVLFNKAIEREGIMALRYFFVHVFVNGKDKGIMAIEEHTSKELLEFHGRRDGPIIKFDESLLGKTIGTPYPHLTDLFVNYRVSQLVPVGTNLEKKSDVFRTQFRTAVGLLRGFVEGIIPASKVFDPVLIGRYLALVKVWGGEHSLGVGNARFYYNPLTAKLEPIGHDAKLRLRLSVFAYEDTVLARMLQDEKIKSVYSETLKRIDDEFNESKALGWAQKVQKKNLGILHKEFFQYEGLDLSRIKERASQLVKMDEELFRSYPDYLKVYYLQNYEGKDVLEIVNTLPDPVVITSIKVVNRLTGKTQTITPLVSSSFPFTLGRTLIDIAQAYNGASERVKVWPPQVKKVVLDKSYSLQEHNIQVYANIKGDSKTKVYDAVLYHPALSKPPIPDSTVEQIVSKFPFIIHSNQKMLLVKQGKWRINEWLFVPEGVKLVIPKGTTLEFDPLVGLITRGPILINGTKDEPVVLKGSGLEETNSPWQGVFVSNVGEASVWSNVTILNTVGMSKNGWAVTAGVTFYQTEVELKKVSFFGNLCEDALNIVRSNFKIEDVEIKNALSDGLDIDFSKGIVREGRFENIGSVGGGDAIDVSGTVIDITGVEFENIQDKAVSVGENSTVHATGLSIKSAGFGVASKDGSRLFLADSVIRESRNMAMVAYTKKKEYGPGAIVAENVKIQNLPKSVVAQSGSQILIDGVALPQVDLNVKNLYATKMKSGLK
jgi:hypothetical protein